MIKIIASLILAIFLFSNISALCNDGQIDINSAPLEKLMDIIWIGNSTAYKIIDYRQTNPFDSLDELTNISGIKSGKLLDIKTQGLACVSLEEANQTNNTKDENQTALQQTQSNLAPAINNTPNITEKPITADIIQLNSKPKDIKTDINVLTSDRIAIYSLVAFCILLGVLFAAKKLKKHKTEFEIKT